MNFERDTGYVGKGMECMMEKGGGGCENRFLRKIEWLNYLVALNSYLANIPIIHRLLL